MTMKIDILKDNLGISIRTANNRYTAIQNRRNKFTVYVHTGRDIKPIEILGKVKYMKDVCELINKYEEA